jgi:hypothetical protein
VSDNNSRTLASNGVNDVGTGGRSYFGGRSEANARSTVARPIPNCLATRRRGTPSATSRLINAQSSTEITHPICLGGLVFDRRYGLVFKRCRHCPSEEVSLPEMSSECICPENGEVRQENFERFAKRSALHRVLSHWR